MVRSLSPQKLDATLGAGFKPASMGAPKPDGLALTENLTLRRGNRDVYRARKGGCQIVRAATLIDL